MAHHIHQDLDICPWTNLCKASLVEKNASSRCSYIMLHHVAFVHHHSSAWPQPWSKLVLGSLTKDLAHSSSYPVHSLWKPEVANHDRNACVVFLSVCLHVSAHEFAIACVYWSAWQSQRKIWQNENGMAIVANQEKLRRLLKSDGLSSSLVSLKSGWVPWSCAASTSPHINCQQTCRIRAGPNDLRRELLRVIGTHKTGNDRKWKKAEDNSSRQLVRSSGFMIGKYRNDTSRFLHFLHASICFNMFQYVSIPTSKIKSSKYVPSICSLCRHMSNIILLDTDDWCSVEKWSRQQGLFVRSSTSGDPYWQ